MKIPRSVLLTSFCLIVSACGNNLPKESETTSTSQSQPFTSTHASNSSISAGPADQDELEVTSASDLSAILPAHGGLSIRAPQIESADESYTPPSEGEFEDEIYASPFENRSHDSSQFYDVAEQQYAVYRVADQANRSYRLNHAAYTTLKYYINQGFGFLGAEQKNRKCTLQLSLEGCRFPISHTVKNGNCARE